MTVRLKLLVAFVAGALVISLAGAASAKVDGGRDP